LMKAYDSLGETDCRSVCAEHGRLALIALQRRLDDIQLGKLGAEVDALVAALLPPAL